MQERSFTCIRLFASDMKHRFLILSFFRLKIIINKATKEEKPVWIRESFWVFLHTLS